jgi:Flp pilus assembly protein TadG
MVEAAFCFLIFLGFIFLIFDMAMGILAKATLQNAVRAGVRYAVTSQTATNPQTGTNLGQIASIKQVVQDQAMGFLSASDLSSFVNVTFYPTNSATPAPIPVDPKTGQLPPGANSAGNMVIVSVNGWPFKPLAPVLHSGASIPITVSSGDLIESNGVSGTAPPSLY